MWTINGRQQTDGNLALEQNNVIVIEAAQRSEAQQLRVAAYCRVSSDSSDQLNSFVAQLNRYSAKYALTERLVCGECGPLYRRCVWSKRGKTRVVWRCASRVDYGTTYCRSSPTLDEKPLQDTILAAINSAMSRKDVLIGQITDAMRMN